MKSQFASLYSHSQDGGDLLLHVLVVGHAGLAVGPVLEARLHVVVDRAALVGAGGGMLTGHGI